MRFKVTITTLLMTLTLSGSLLLSAPSKAEAQLGGLLGGITGLLGGGDPVRIVSDVSETTIANTLKTALIELSNAFIGGEISSINLKETVLDPIAWNMAKQLQQQLTGNLLKWLGGQLPGQNGEAAFVQNYGKYYGQLSDAVAGEFIFGDQISGLCSPEEDHQIKVQVYESVIQQRNEEEGPLFQCSDETNNEPEDSDLDRMFFGIMSCSDANCAGFKAKYKLAVKRLNAFANEKQVLDYSRGMKTQKICQTVTGSGGTGTSTECGLVSPPFLSADTTSFQLAQLPSLQLLQMDEFNEIVSNLMSNLTNQALTGLTGVLGLSGNPTYSRNVFGEGGNLSYVDALIADDITSYQTATGNPIREALNVEKEYEVMQKKIAAELKVIEDKLTADTAEFAGCFDLELTDELKKAKNDNITSLAIASTSIAILTALDIEYASSTSASAKGAVMSTFISYKNQGLFRTQYDNQQFKVTYLDYTFAKMTDIFRYDIATERAACGGEFDYEGVLNPPNDNET